MITRNDYMERRVTHQQYYAAIVKTAGIGFHPNDPFIVRCRAALAGGDEHLNTIPLADWDAIGRWGRACLGTAFRLHGDIYSLAGSVCAYKEAAAQACAIVG